MQSPFPPTPLSERRPPSPVIYGLAGESLSADEAAFFREADPLGFILFGRNCKDAEQLRALTDTLRACLGRGVPILIDQEGGRVQRMKAPAWPAYAAAASFEHDPLALRDMTIAMAADLVAAGITVNCAPVLDVTFPQTHAAIGDRSYSAEPEIVAARAMVVCRAYLDHHIIPIVKHMPGLGRADLDTHKDLPVVTASFDDLAAIDFYPYRRLMETGDVHAIWGMVGHAVYTALDDGTPASCSKFIIENIIRDHMKFSGILVSDDLSMDALSLYGAEDERAARVLAAGCDIALHCNGKLDEMKIVANRIPGMANPAILRYNSSIR